MKIEIKFWTHFKIIMAPFSVAITHLKYPLARVWILKWFSTNYLAWYIQLYQTPTLEIVSHLNPVDFLGYLWLCGDCIPSCLSGMAKDYIVSIQDILTFTLKTSRVTHARSCIISLIDTPTDAKMVHNSAIPPGLSLRLTENLTRRPSAARPRSIHLPRIVVSMLPPQSGSTTLQQER